MPDARINQTKTKNLDENSSASARAIPEGAKSISFKAFSTNSADVTVTNSDNDNSFTLEAGDIQSFDCAYAFNAWLVGVIGAGDKVDVIYYN